MQLIHTFGIWLSMCIFAIADKIHHAGPNHEIDWIDHLRWFVERIGDRIFIAAYAGSREELQAVEDDEIPLMYMTRRQLDHYQELTGVTDDELESLIQEQEFTSRKELVEDGLEIP